MGARGGARRNKGHGVTLTMEDSPGDRPPPQPTDAPAGSEEKIREMIRRRKRREPLTCRRDAQLDMGAIGHARAPGNFALVKTGALAPDVEVTLDTDFARRLSRLRRAKGLKPGALAKRAGVAKSYITRLERAERDMPRGYVLWALADALGLATIDELVGREARP
jgi:ribosome-binding protein aMBF1 (putative translation factor)